LANKPVGVLTEQTRNANAGHVDRKSQLERELNLNNLERIPVYTIEASSDPFLSFKERWENLDFRRSRLTYLTLLSLLVLYPGTSLLFTDDPATMLKGLNQEMLMLMLVSTIVIQWCVFLLIYVSSCRERTGLAGLGFKRVRALDFAWAGAFLLTAFVVMAGLTWFLAQIGLPMPGEISLLIPTDLAGRVVWVAVSATAAICEETAFRGYLLTRLRLLGKLQSWVIPTMASALVFGTCHSYQGLPGFIVITVYGVMLSLLYIRSGSIWPGIIAHFFQDFLALFVPQ
jgi:membrane protease YdiL (CAAX protease family)